ncbi:hypothetical protein SKAU_G00343510 [Synaphobranchus kaupii]|uniref:Uncharacterized protein n=1 Tax=Synaphobranchus kaupii TaxID=118154 RepID=A0A9Q1IFB7_SYNKA|nr:hypothetical protein SKAU_G00343510 [Synaphobranchus kaupii]
MRRGIRTEARARKGSQGQRYREIMRPREHGGGNWIVMGMIRREREKGRAGRRGGAPGERDRSQDRLSGRKTHGTDQESQVAGSFLSCLKPFFLAGVCVRNTATALDSERDSDSPRNARSTSSPPPPRTGRNDKTERASPTDRPPADRPDRSPSEPTSRYHPSDSARARSPTTPKTARD